MAKLSSIAKVIIDLRTAAIGTANFGIPMIMAPLGSQFLDRVYTLESANDAVDMVGADGVTKLPADVVRAVQIAFSQKPRIDKVMLGKIIENTLFTVTCTGLTAVGDDAGIVIDGTLYKYVATATNETATKVRDGLYALVNVPTVTDRYILALVGGATGTGFTLLPKNPSAPYSVTNMPGDINANVTTSSTMAGGTGNIYNPQLTEIQGIDNTWYGFTILGVTDADQPEIALWAESAEPPVQYWTTSNTPDIWETTAAVGTDILSQLKAQQYERTSMTPTMNLDQMDHIAAMARFYVGSPGSIVAGLKTLTGITPTAFTAQQGKNVMDKNGNTYEKYSNNVYVFNPGKAVSGNWLDEVRDRDWLVNYIQTSMASALLRAPKIPYTNQGIAVLVNVLNGCLRFAQKQGVIAPDQVDDLGNTVPGFVIEAPNALSVPFDQKASRVLNLKFTALLAGAIQQVVVEGVLTYNYDEVV